MLLCRPGEAAAIQLHDHHPVTPLGAGQHQVFHQVCLAAVLRAGNQESVIPDQIEGIDLRALGIVAHGQNVRILQRLPVLFQRREVCTGSLLRNTGNCPGPRACPRRVHPLYLGLYHIVPLRAALSMGGKSRLEFQHTILVIHQAAAFDTALRQHGRPHNVQHIRISEHIRHLEGKAGTEILRHTGGQFLHTDTAGRDQQEDTAADTLLHQTHHDGLIRLARLFMEAAVVVDHDQDRRNRPAVVVYIILKVRSGKKLLPLVQNTGNHGKELSDLVALHIRFVHIAAHMLQICKHRQHFGAEVQTIHIEDVRRIGLGQRVDHCLQEGGLAGGNRTGQHMVTALRKVDGHGELRLIFRIVGHADHGVQLEALRLLRPVGPVEGISGMLLQRIQIQIFRQHGKPELTDIIHAHGMSHAVKIAHKDFKLRLSLDLGQTAAVSRRAADHAVYQRLAAPRLVRTGIRLAEVADTRGIELILLEIRFNSMNAGINGGQKRMLLRQHEVPAGNGAMGLLLRVLDDLDQLPHPAAFEFLFPLELRMITHQIHLSGGVEHLGDQQIAAAQLFVIQSAGPAALEQLENFVVAHLQVATARLRQIGGLRPVQHVDGVLTILHPQAQTELTVGPDVLVHRAGGTLCGQDQVYA